MVTFGAISARNKLFLPAALGLVTLAATLFLGYLADQEKNLVEKNRVELEELQRDLRLLDKILVDQKVYEDKISTAFRTLPSSFEDVAFFVSQIERIAELNGQTLVISIGQSTKKEPIAESLKFTLTVTGGYSALADLFSGIANLPYHTRVDSIKAQGTGLEITSLVDFRLFVTKNDQE